MEELDAKPLSEEIRAALNTELSIMESRLADRLVRHINRVHNSLNERIGDVEEELKEEFRTSKVEAALTEDKLTARMVVIDRRVRKIIDRTTD